MAASQNSDAEATFRRIFQRSPVGMARVRLSDDGFVDVNDALCTLTGYGREALERTTIAAITHPDDRAADVRTRKALIAGDLGAVHLEKRWLTASGEVLWVMVSASVMHGGGGAPEHMVLHAQDITERRTQEEMLRHQADHDPLTGLHNRRRFETELSNHLHRNERYGPEGCLLVFDLDHFKNVNDTLGQVAGDELIVTVAGLLRDRLRESDILARLGGDEFGVLLPRAQLAEASTVAGEIIRIVREQAIVVQDPQWRHMTASVGVASFAEAGRAGGREVIVNADVAMHEAKQAGRDRFRIYSRGPVARGHTDPHASWPERIRRALQLDHFELYAQPILDLQRNTVTRYELLLRLPDADGGVISPAAFLHIAERFGLMADIDRWVVRRAIELVAQHRSAERPVCFEVNISGSSLGNQALLDEIRQALADTAIPPGCLVFEITETAAVSNFAVARHFAAQLSELGCRFALDDFGSGFGSFFYLKHLPFDYIKIDGEFIRECTRNPTDQLVIAAIVDIARGLEKKTVAEYVGDEPTLAHLRELGIDYAQGFHLGKPLPVAQTLAA